MNPGFASVLFSLVLIGLKVIGILAAVPWWLVLLPVYFWYALTVAVVLGAFFAVLITIPIVGVSLLVGPLLERLAGGRKTIGGGDEKLFKLSGDALPNTRESLPEGAVEDGTLADHDGPVYGYVRVPNSLRWWGPKKFLGTKSIVGRYPMSDSAYFAHAPTDHDETPTHNSDADTTEQEAQDR